MKHSHLFIALSVTLSTLYLTGCNKEQAKQQAAVQQQMPPAVVNVMPVQFQTVPLMQEFAGRTVAYGKTDVRPQATGTIEEILYQEGSMVEKGQPLYRLSIENYEPTQVANAGAVQQAAANVSTAEASYNQAVANIAAQQAKYNSALANHTAQQAQLEQAQVDLQRLEPLVEIKAISQQRFDQAVTAYKTAQAAVASSEAAIEQATANITNAEAAAEQAKAKIAGANAAVETAQAKLVGSQVNLEHTIVRAPISGKTDRAKVTAGTLVNANQASPLVTVSQLNPIYVDISQSSADLLQLKQQQANGSLQPGSTSVELILEDGSTYPIRGQLSLAEAKVDEKSGSVTLRAVFQNDNYLLLPGMFVNARLTQGLMNNSVLVPQSALVRTPKGETQVYIADQNNTVQVRSVTVNGTYKNNWIITDGLQSGDNIIVIGGAKVKPKQEVVVKPLPPTPEQIAAQAQAANNPETSPVPNDTQQDTESAQ